MADILCSETEIIFSDELLANFPLRNELTDSVFPKCSFSMICEYFNKNRSMISPWMQSDFAQYCEFGEAILLS